MSSIDLSRSAHQPTKQYNSVRLQQGRVILDDDWNESESITDYERVESLVDLVGPFGTSDDALAVSAVQVAVDGAVDFSLGQGTMYVAGRRVAWPAGRRYLFQDSWFSPPSVPAPAGDRNDLVWCEVIETPVTAIEDAELLEVGLGGPDTSARTRLITRVHVETGTPEDCEAAFESTVGADVNPRGTVTTDATLSVGFVPGTTPTDLCTPHAAGGYLSHLNQAIRVQCTDATHFTWGHDNASPLYRVELLADRQTIRFRTQPPDEAHWPRSGQVVELLPWASALPNGQVQAAETGQLAVVDTPFDPDSDELTLTAAVPPFGEDDWVGRPDQAVLEADGRYVYLRVWERGDDTSGPTLAFAAGGAPVALGNTGLEVSFTGSDFRRGDHWIIAARPAEPLKVVPWDFISGRTPHGPVRHRAPLAVIRWRGGAPTVQDCRRRFRPLTELQGCCDITVGDGSHSFGDVESIQEAVDLLPDTGGRICVRSGRYDERITIANRVRVEISGCGDDTVIAPSDGDTGPVIAIEGSRNVVLRQLRLEVPAAAEGVRIGLADPCHDVTLEQLDISAGARQPGVRFMSPGMAREPSSRFSMTRTRVDARSLDAPPNDGEIIELWPAVVVQGVDLTVADCTITADESPLTGALGGLQVAGLSADVTVARNVIAGGNGNGVTLGSIAWVLPDEVGDAVRDYEKYVAEAKSVGWLVWFDGGCIKVGGDLPPDRGGDGAQPVPLSVGPVRDLVIEDNEIRSMAADGIGIARFFEPGEGERSDIVTVERARIDRNLIRANRRTPPIEGSAALARLSGHGGIALAEAVDLRVRDNRILANGPSTLVPTCGVFVLTGESLLLTGNDIADNGADPDPGGVTRLGNRGGVVIRYCRAASVGQPHEPETPEIGSLLLHDNRVAQPAGQAVWVMGVGQMSVRDNQLSAGSLPASDILAAVLRLLEGGFDDLDDVLAIAIAHVAGVSVTLWNQGIPIDFGQRQISAAKYTPGSAGLMSSGQLLASDPGRKAYEDATHEETEVATPKRGIDDVAYASAGMDRLLQGGHVAFHGNQVTLDLLDEGQSLAVCSVLVLSFDDLAVQQNQIRCLTGDDLVLVDAIAAAMWTARCQGNRLQEVRAERGAFASLLTWATANVTTGNQCSRPYLASAGSAAMLVDEHNLVLP